jgi:hypothetical protein
MELEITPQLDLQLFNQEKLDKIGELIIGGANGGVEHPR